eukprot:2579857-Karenia_brevis.AAC.1
MKAHANTNHYPLWAKISIKLKARPRTQFKECTTEEGAAYNQALLDNTLEVWDHETVKEKLKSSSHWQSAK